MQSALEMKKFSYWFSIVFGGMLGLVFSSAWEVFSVPNKAISYQQDMYIQDTMVTNANGQQVTAHLLKGALWNSGQTTIDTTEVREPLCLSIIGAEQILDYSITRQIHPRTSQFNLTPGGSTRLAINWKYFDPKDGFSFQILYTGSKEATIQPEGRIIYLYKYYKVQYQLYEVLSSVRGLGLVFLLMFIVSLYLLYTKQIDGVMGYVLTILGTLSAAILGSFFTFEWLKILYNPPFEALVS